MFLEGCFYLKMSLMCFCSAVSCLRLTTSGPSTTCSLLCSFYSSSVRWWWISLMKAGKVNSRYFKCAMPINQTCSFALNLHLHFVSLGLDWCWISTCWSMHLGRSPWWCAHGFACFYLCCWFPSPCSTCGPRASLGVTVTPGCTTCCLPLCTCSTRVCAWDSCQCMWWWPTVCHLLPVSSSFLSR